MILQWSSMGIVSVAPMVRATSSENGRREMAMTRAPVLAARRVSMAPRKPMPTMATVWPGSMALRWRMFTAQPSGSPGKGRPASEGGSGTTALAGARSYSA
jgi:hypothetical protein